MRREECDALAAECARAFGGISKLAHVRTEQQLKAVLSRFETEMPAHCRRLKYIFHAQQRFYRMLEVTGSVCLLVCWSVCLLVCWSVGLLVCVYACISVSEHVPACCACVCACALLAFSLFLLTASPLFPWLLSSAVLDCPPSPPPIANTKAWRAGDVASVGEIFRMDGIGLRDVYEISGPELETMCDIVRTVPGVLGEQHHACQGQLAVGVAAGESARVSGTHRHANTHTHAHAHACMHHPPPPLRCTHH